MRVLAVGPGDRVTIVHFLQQLADWRFRALPTVAPGDKTITKAHERSGDGRRYIPIRKA